MKNRDGFTIRKIVCAWIVAVVLNMSLPSQSLPTATTNAASAVTAYGAILNGTVNAQNNTTAVTFEYGLNTGYGRTMTANQNPLTGSVDTAVNISIYELLPNTTYHFRVVAANISGTVYGDDMTFTTSAPAPDAVTTAATDVGLSGATLNGTINANNSSTTATFEYGLTTAYGTTVTAAQSPVGGIGHTAVSAVISGLTAGMTYHFRVQGLNAGGAANGLDQTFITGIMPTVTTLAASALGATAVTLNGTVNANGSTTTVTFEYGTSTAYGRIANAVPGVVTGSGNTAVSAALSGMNPNTTYHFRAVGLTSDGHTVHGSDLTFATQALAPTAVTSAASSVTATTATLNGTVNANNDTTTVTFQYGLTTAYGTTVTANQSPVSGVSDIAVTRAIGGLTDSTTYHYRVVAQNSSGTTYGSDVTFTTGGSFPTAVTGTATTVTSTGATLNGTVNAQNDSTAVTFEFGQTSSYRNTFTAAQSPVTGNTDCAVSYAVSGLIHSTTYHYRVVGQNSRGTTYGADQAFTTSAPPPIVTTQAASGVSNTDATLNGIVNANLHTTTVTFQYGLTTAYGTEVNASPSPVSGGSDTAISAVISGLSSLTTYHFRVKGSYSGGTEYGLDRTFTTYANSFIVSGTVSDGVNPISGVVVACSEGSDTTKAKGIFRISVPCNATITLTPSHAGYHGWSPTSRTLSNIKANQVNQNFQGVINTYVISGKVNVDGAALSGVTMNGLPGTPPQTNASGFYAGTVNYGWSGTVTPQLPGYLFTPAARGYNSVASSWTKQHYTAQPQFILISPNGGETWSIGSVQTITWMPGRCTGLVKLTLFRAGVNCGIFAKNIPASACSYTWKVGTKLAMMLTAGSGYTMQLSSMDNSFSDFSDASFDLAAAGLSRLPAGLAAQAWRFSASLLTDVDGDGDADLLLGGRTGQDDSLLLNDGRGYFHAAPTRSLPLRSGISCGETLWLAALGADIVRLERGFGDQVQILTLLKNDGSGAFTQSGEPYEITCGCEDGFTRVDVLDLDRDDRPDLVLSGANATPKILINTGGSGWIPFNKDFGLLGTLVSTDVNADGPTDLISFAAPQQATVWFNRSQLGMPGFEPQSWALPALEPAAADRRLRPGVVPLLAGDFCRDGGTMLFAANREETVLPGKIVLLKANHGLIWSDESTTRLPGLHLFVGHAAVGDINGDGYLDLFLGSNRSDNFLLLLLNDGSGRFSGEN